MTDRSISQSSTKNQGRQPYEIIHELSVYYRKPAHLVIYHLYEKFNYTYADIAKILGISYQRVERLYPKKKKEDQRVK